MTWDEMRRYRKFGIKFALHDKCKPSPEKKERRNDDLPTLIKNVKVAPDNFLRLLGSLADDFLVYKNKWEGIEPDCFQANTITRERLSDLFPNENPDEVPFQEIHRSLYWDKKEHSEIISNQNKLAAECVKTILKLYPFFLYATTPDERVLIREIKAFEMSLDKNKDVFSGSSIERLEEECKEFKIKDKADFEKAFGKYVFGTKELRIRGRFIVKNKILQDTIIRFCDLVKQKKVCKVCISTPKFSELTRNERENLDKTIYDLRLRNLISDIIKLGFRKTLVEIDHDDPIDRRIDTDMWIIEETTGHPLDFILPDFTVKRWTCLKFIPKRMTIFD
jgi:hypothetical protein